MHIVYYSGFKPAKMIYERKSDRLVLMRGESAEFPGASCDSEPDKGVQVQMVVC